MRWRASPRRLHKLGGIVRSFYQTWRESQLLFTTRFGAKRRKITYYQTWCEAPTFFMLSILARRAEIFSYYLKWPRRSARGSGRNRENCTTYPLAWLFLVRLVRFVPKSHHGFWPIVPKIGAICVRFVKKGKQFWYEIQNVVHSFERKKTCESRAGQYHDPAPEPRLRRGEILTGFSGIDGSKKRP